MFEKIDRYKCEGCGCQVDYDEGEGYVVYLPDERMKKYCDDCGHEEE